MEKINQFITDWLPPANTTMGTLEGFMFIVETTVVLMAMFLALYFLFTLIHLPFLMKAALKKYIYTNKGE